MRTITTRARTATSAPLMVVNVINNVLLLALLAGVCTGGAAAARLGPVVHSSTTSSAGVQEEATPCSTRSRFHYYACDGGRFVSSYLSMYQARLKRLVWFLNTEQKKENHKKRAMLLLLLLFLYDESEADVRRGVDARVESRRTMYYISTHVPVYRRCCGNRSS